MRSVLSISLPNEEAKKRVQAMAKAAGMSLSAFILQALDAEEKRQSWEKDMLQMSQEAREEYESGQSQELSSLEDLMLNHEN